MPDNAQHIKPLAGQIIVVTGSSSGIGAEIAKTLGAAGAKIVVNYFGRRDSAETVVHKIIRNGGNAIAVKADVGSEKDVAAMFLAALETFDTVDILVSNAGVQTMGHLPI